MIRSLTLKEFDELMTIIHNDHFLKNKNIKYVKSEFDNRSLSIYSISIRKYGSSYITFSTNIPYLLTNEFKYNSLFDWIKAYLDDKWIGTVWFNEYNFNYK